MYIYICIFNPFQGGFPCFRGPKRHQTNLSPRCQSLDVIEGFLKAKVSEVGLQTILEFLFTFHILGSLAWYIR